MRNYRSRVLGLLLVLSFVLPAWAAESIHDLLPTVILVSFDGFRADYLDRIPTPNLHAIVERGVRAKYMIPSFPTKTFPNHYSIVTGLYPAHHGIVANNFFDPNLNRKFRMTDVKSRQDPQWWGGEPIWVTAEKQGIRTAPLMWPGGDAQRPGMRPTFIQEYDEKLSPSGRVDKLVSLLDLPVDQRPRFLTLYINIVDDAGHHYGPGSQQVTQAVTEADAAVGRLVQALKDRGIEDQVNLIFVSDHGMSPIPEKKTVFLDDYLDMNSVDVIDGSPILMLRPKDGNYDALYAKLKRVPHAKVYRTNEAPERWHFSGSDRILPVFTVADDEWTITTHEYRKNHKPDFGNHGFDNYSKHMRALFVAAGPGFQHGTLKPFENVNLYSLFAYLLNLAPAKTDGSLDVFKSILVERPQVTPSKRALAPWQKEWDEVARLGSHH